MIQTFRIIRSHGANQKPKIYFEQSRPIIRTYAQLNSTAQEQRIKVNNQTINFIKLGHGPHNVLCVPGGIGTMWTDFKPQLEGFDKDKFTLIAYDSPGLGKSRPPDKKYTGNFLEEDADFAYGLMKELQMSKFSILGWSYGSMVSMILAATHPEATKKLVIWGTHSFMLPQELEAYKTLYDIRSWSKKMLQPRIDVYGEKAFLKHIRHFIDGIVRHHNDQKGDMCTGYIKHIQCPAFILYGEKDALINPIHVQLLKAQITNSRIHVYPLGCHNFHLRYAKDFNMRVQEFLVHEDI